MGTHSHLVPIGCSTSCTLHNISAVNTTETSSKTIRMTQTDVIRRAFTSEKVDNCVGVVTRQVHGFVASPEGDYLLHLYSGGDETTVAM